MRAGHMGEDILIGTDGMCRELIFNIGFEEAVGQAGLTIQTVNVKLAPHFIQP